MSRQAHSTDHTRTPRDAEPPGPNNATAAQRRSRARKLLVWSIGLIAVAGLASVALISARPQVSETTTTATDFTLPDTEGNMITLSSLRGDPVLLYFNEGAGCEACIYQMKAIEEDSGFAAAGIVVLPIVMDSLDQIRAAMSYVGVATPFLMDDGKVSAAYGALGTGMHADLPGHGFVLINADGQQVWQGNYPSMWLPPEELLAKVRERL